MGFEGWGWDGLTEVGREVDVWVVVFGWGVEWLEDVGWGWVGLGIIERGKWVVLVGGVLLRVEFKQVFLSAGFGVVWQDLVCRGDFLWGGGVAFPAVMHRFSYGL